LGLGPDQPVFSPNYDQFADLRWSKDDLALAFDNPIGLLTQALVADLNQAVERREAGVGGRGDGDEATSPEAETQGSVAVFTGAGEQGSIAALTDAGEQKDDGTLTKVTRRTQEREGNKANAQSVSVSTATPLPSLPVPLSAPTAKPSLSSVRPQPVKRTGRQAAPIPMPALPVPRPAPISNSSARLRTSLQVPISNVQSDKIVLMFDDFAPVVGEWLLTHLLGHAREAITCDLRLVFAGRHDLFSTDERWATQWADFILPLALAPFTSAEVVDFMSKNAPLTTPAAITRISEAAACLPIWLNIWLIGGADPLAAGQGVELSNNLTESQRGWLDKAALAGSFDQPRLMTLIGSEEGRAAFTWLISRQALVRTLATPGQFQLDRTLAEALTESLFELNESQFAADKQNLLDYLDHQLTSTQMDLSTSSVPDTQTNYRAVALERLAHTLDSRWPVEDTTPAESFLCHVFLTALDENPPLMFDLLTLATETKEQESEATLTD